MWFQIPLKHSTPVHAIFALMRKSYRARIDGCRALRRGDIKMGARTEDSTIVLKPKKKWTESKWEPITEEVFQAFKAA